MERRIWLPIVLLSLALPRLAAAQDGPVVLEGGPTCPAGEACPMHEEHGEMHARHQEMMAHHARSAARLQALQDRMHEVTGDARVDAVVALLDEMLAQHRAMHAKMMESHHPMGHGERKHEGVELDQMGHGETDDES